MIRIVVSLVEHNIPKGMVVVKSTVNGISKKCGIGDLSSGKRPDAAAK